MRSIVLALLLASSGLVGLASAGHLDTAPCVYVNGVCQCPPGFQESGSVCIKPRCEMSCSCPNGQVFDEERHECVPLSPDPDPECAEDQPWVGYRSTEPVRQLATGTGLDAGMCEGEHWDGQDAIRAGGEACQTEVLTTDGTPWGASYCHGHDPNACCTLDPLALAGLRVTLTGHEAYAAGGAILVGNAALYVGLRDDVMVAAYYRDGTPGNLVFSIVPRPPVSYGHVNESDCDQAAYQQAAWNQAAEQCGRDNTAFTAYAGLP